MDDAGVPRDNPGFLTAIVAPACFVAGLYLGGTESAFVFWTGWTIGLLVAAMGTVRAWLAARGRTARRGPAFLPVLWVNFLIVLLFLVAAWALTRDTRPSAAGFFAYRQSGSQSASSTLMAVTHAPVRPGGRHRHERPSTT
jgi:hypothetical protein